MSLRVYNTLTRQKEDFQTVVPGEVRMYLVRSDGLQAGPYRPHGRAGHFRHDQALPGLSGYR